VADACQILAGWHNVYGHNPKHTEANDGVAFTTTGNTEEKIEKKNKKDKKKNITCFKCKKKGHYSNECPDDEENNKIGSSFLVLNTQDSSDESVDDDTPLTISHANIAAVQESGSSDEESVEDTEEGDHRRGFKVKHILGD